MTAAPLIGVLGYGAAALAWAALAVLLTVRGAGRGPGRLLVGGALVQVAWAVAMAGTLTVAALPAWVAFFLEAARPLAWTLFLLALLWAPGRPRPIVAAGLVVAGIAVMQGTAFTLDTGAQERFGSGLLAAVLGLVCVEQLYRNTPEGRRWAVKFLCLALAAIAAFDIVLYADALLFGRFEFGWWAARGYAHAFVVPLIAVSAARTPDWRLDIQVSRTVVLHTATLLASGAFLLAVAAIGYGLQFFGGAWGGVAQTLVIFASLVALVAMVASGTVRAKLRVLLAKHFYSYRYDYRAEWLRLTDLLARSERAGGLDGSLSARALQGLGMLVESTAGALWLRAEDGAWICDAR
ncbi:MAG TPA: hypothetical protein VD931_10040, partial [Baekduia sp.]|nr:hypothetical protein [Baekduia sp.]